MTKRKAETIVEVVTAMAIFGMIMAGVSDFIAGQTKNVADILDRDAIMQAATKVLDYYYDNKKWPDDNTAKNNFGIQIPKKPTKGATTIDEKTLTLAKGITSMDFVIDYLPY